MTNKFIKVGNRLLVLNRGYCDKCLFDRFCSRGEVGISICEVISDKFSIKLFDNVEGIHTHIIFTKSISISLFLSSIIKNKFISVVGEVDDKTLIDIYEL